MAARKLGMSPAALGNLLNGRIFSQTIAERLYKTYPALMPPELLAHYGLGGKTSATSRPANVSEIPNNSAAHAGLRASTRT